MYVYQYLSLLYSLFSLSHEEPEKSITEHKSLRNFSGAIRIPLALHAHCRAVALCGCSHIRACACKPAQRFMRHPRTARRYAQKPDPCFLPEAVRRIRRRFSQVPARTISQKGRFVKFFISVWEDMFFFKIIKNKALCI